MARLYQLGVQAVRPGTYFRTSSGDVTTVGAVNGIVAVPYQSNWGELGKVVDISPEDLNDLREIVGTGRGYQVIREALIGGATTVRSIRVGTGGLRSRMKFKTIAYTTTTTPPATTENPNPAPISTTTTYTGVTLYAKYPGYRIFYGTLRPHPSEVNQKQLLIYDDQARLIEEVSFSSGGDETTKMANAVNEGCQYFTATVNTAGKKLADVSSNKIYYSLTAAQKAEVAAARATKTTAAAKAAIQTKMITEWANPTVHAAHYEDATNALERYYWNVIVADSHTDQVNAYITTFVRQSYQNGHFGMCVITAPRSSEKNGKTIDARVKFAASVNDWRVVYLLNGWRTNTGEVMEGYVAAARIAGMIAACETNASLTHIVVQDALELLEPMRNGDIIAAEEKGCFVLTLNDEDQIWIDNAINTLITLGNDQDEGWKKIRRTKCRFELMTRVNRTCDKLIGRLNNDKNGRATIVTAMQSIINEMIAEGKLFFGSYAAEDPNHKSVGDRAYFVLIIGDIDSLEHIYLDYNFSYANPFSELDTVASA